MNSSGLGRGLDVLLPQNDELFQTVVQEIAIDDIDPNTAQPRKDFDKEALEQLAESIRSAGVLSPILVVQDGMRYRIVAGERRYRASRLAGLSTVPCIVRDLTNEQQMEAALIENLQREDLNPVEEAQGYQVLMQDYGLTQEQVAQRMGKSRPAITNMLRLLALPEEVLALVEEEQLSAGHARAFLAAPTADLQRQAAQQVVEHQLSDRQTEALIKALQKGEKPPKEPDGRPDLALYLGEVEKSLSSSLGRKVTISHKGKKGRIQLEYYDDQDLESLLALLQQHNGEVEPL